MSVFTQALICNWWSCGWISPCQEIWHLPGTYFTITWKKNLLFHLCYSCMSHMGEQLLGWLSENMSPKHFGKPQMLLHVGLMPHVLRVTAMFRWKLFYVHVWSNAHFAKTNGDLNKAWWINAYGNESNCLVQTVWTELRIWHSTKCCCRCF